MWIQVNFWEHPQRYVAGPYIAPDATTQSHYNTNTIPNSNSAYPTNPIHSMLYKPHLVL